MSRTKLCNWPDEQPEDCSRICKKFFEAHTIGLSMALYSHPTLMPTTICAYSFCCGTELRVHHEVKDGETIAMTIQQLVVRLSAMHMTEAAEELQSPGVCKN